MKKLLYIFFAVALLVSCSSDDDKDPIEYLDNNLIAGSWYWIQATDSSVYTFQNNAATLKVYEKYTLQLMSNYELGGYKLTSENILFNGNYFSELPYRIESNKLYIKESNGGIYTEYTKVK